MSNCLPTLWQTLEDSFSEGKKEGILDHSSKTERIGGFSSDPRQKEGGEKCLKMTLAKRHVEKEKYDTCLQGSTEIFPLPYEAANDPAARDRHPTERETYI